MNVSKFFIHIIFDYLNQLDICDTRMTYFSVSLFHLMFDLDKNTALKLMSIL